MSKSKDTIFKDYIKKDKLGAGGYGTVYLVESDKGIPFALKVLHKDVHLIEREARETISINDPRLVKVIDYGETVDGEPCILMEYIPDNLESALDWGDIPEDKAVELFREILLGLETLEAHSLLHRDIKPDNFFLASNIVKIGDFGSAKITSGQSSSMSQNAAMTLHYSAPERFDDEDGYGFEVDRWSAAVVFCRMLTGAVPFAAKSKSLQPIMKAICMGKPDISAVPERFKPFFEKAFEKDADARHSCVEEMREHLDACISGDAERLRAEEVERIRREEQERAKAELAKQQRELERERKLREEAERQRKEREEAARKKAEAEKNRGPNAGDEWTEPTTGMKFVWVPAGTFMMGSEKYDEEQPIHKVELDGFWIGKYPVTQGEWKKIMDTNPAKFKKGDNHPVETVSWDDSKEFIEKISAKNGWKYSFSLPSEAQWEYAARSGGRNETYSGSEDVKRVAWFEENSNSGTHPIGRKAPNGLGLHDMSGNVWEWCEDFYDKDAYAKHAYKNPVNLSEGDFRVIRGGCWGYIQDDVRCACRNDFTPDFSYNDIGLRLVRTN